MEEIGNFSVVLGTTATLKLPFSFEALQRFYSLRGSVQFYPNSKKVLAMELSKRKSRLTDYACVSLRGHYDRRTKNP